MTTESSMPQLSIICSLLGDVITSQSAARLIPTIDTLPTSGDLITAPSWAWTPPRIDVGRKGKTASGELTKMPVRLDWTGGNVFVTARDENPDAPFRFIGLGHDARISSRVLQTEDTILARYAGATFGSAPELVHFTSHRQLERNLRGLVKKGSHSRWELVSGLEPFTLRKLTQANGRVAAELGEYRAHAAPKVLDEIAIDGLLADLLYGDGQSSVIIRMLERGTNPLTFMRVDPMHYFAVNIRARAEEAIRRRIGDPKIGPKVRRVQAKVQAETVEELIEAYRLIHPKDALARKRAIAALTAGAEITAHQKMFHDNVTAVTEPV